jgi:hypothetical protein
MSNIECFQNEEQSLNVKHIIIRWQELYFLCYFKREIYFYKQLYIYTYILIVNYHAITFIN